MSGRVMFYAQHLLGGIQYAVIVGILGCSGWRAIENEVKSRKAPTILTPHPGEMSRLSGMTLALQSGTLAEDKYVVAAMRPASVTR